MDSALLVLRLALAAVFAIAAIGKITDRPGSEKAFAEFGLPEITIRPMAYFLPVLELCIAIALVFVEVSWFAALAGSTLFLVFTLGMLYQMARGNAPDCHCFGQIHSQPVSILTVLRNVVLLAMALGLVVAGRANQGLNVAGSSQDFMQFLIGIVMVGLLAAVVHFLKKISEQQTQIMRRIELIELVGGDGGSVEREDIAHPHEGLPVGAIFPDFELPDLDGKLISLTDIKIQKKPLLFLFVSPTCNPCKALVPEFEKWEIELKGKVQFVYLSNGDAEENLAKFGGNSKKLILLQKSREVADSVNAQWTPTAILVDAGGRLASHATAGDSAIRSLIDQIKTSNLDKEFTHFTNGHNHANTNKVGSVVPDFSVEDIKGRTINSDYFLGRKTLVAFWSLTCPHCTAMMEELREWDMLKGKDDPALVVFSDGTKNELEEFALDSPIVVDTGHKTSAGFGMFGTPSAVLVNENGKIISETATGSRNIWSLVGNRNS